jgi:hypothetical protein
MIQGLVVIERMQQRPVGEIADAGDSLMRRDRVDFGMGRWRKWEVNFPMGNELHQAANSTWRPAGGAH